MNFGEMLDQVRRAGGMDVDTGLAGIWINERYKRLAVASGWSRAIVSIGDTVADQSAYTLPESVTEIHELRIGTTPYRRVGVQSMWDLQGDLTGLDGSGGVYAPNYTTAGMDEISINPTPGESGEEITALATITPGDLSNKREVPAVPPDFHQSICEGAMADAFAYIDENIGAADRYEARFDAAVEKLSRRRNKRVGGGPAYVQVEGVHYQR